MSTWRERVQALADGITAGTQDFIAGFEKAGEGIGTRMSGETAAMIVQVRAEMRSYVLDLLTEEDDEEPVRLSVGTKVRLGKQVFTIAQPGKVTFNMSNWIERKQEVEVTMFFERDIPEEEV